MDDETRKNAYLSDQWTLKDKLRFSDYKPALMDILLNAGTPLTVGVYGTWGSGKTSLLRMLKQEIDDQERQKHSDGVVHGVEVYPRRSSLEGFHPPCAGLY